LLRLKRKDIIILYYHKFVRVDSTSISRLYENQDDRTVIQLLRKIIYTLSDTTRTINISNARIVLDLRRL